SLSLRLPSHNFVNISGKITCRASPEAALERCGESACALVSAVQRNGDDGHSRSQGGQGSEQSCLLPPAARGHAGLALEVPHETAPAHARSISGVVKRQFCIGLRLQGFTKVAEPLIQRHWKIERFRGEKGQFFQQKFADTLYKGCNRLVLQFNQT